MLLDVMQQEMQYPPTFARASRALPSSTKASSMTGSSMKLASKPRLGSSAAAAPTLKLVLLPMATRLFMLGLPAHRDLNPSMSKLQAEQER